MVRGTKLMLGACRDRKGAPAAARAPDLWNVVSGGLVHLLPRFGEQFDHGLVELRNVGGLTAAHPVAIANYRLVGPVGSGILQIVRMVL